MHQLCLLEALQVGRDRSQAKGVEAERSAQGRQSIRRTVLTWAQRASWVSLHGSQAGAWTCTFSHEAMLTSETYPGIFSRYSGVSLPGSLHGRDALNFPSMQFVVLSPCGSGWCPFREL